MAISLKTAGSWARVVTDPSSVTIPGTPAAGDRMFLFANWKTFSVTVGDPNGWTPIVNSFADGAVAAGNGTGSVSVAAWYRDWQSGDGNPSLDWSAAPTEAHAVIMLWQKGGGDLWGTPTYVTAAITANDPWSATASTTLTVDDGAVVMSMVAFRDDLSTIARAADDIDDDGSPAVTWNGNYVESPATHFTSTTGLDMAGDLGHRFVTTGAAGVSLTTAGDPSAAETGSALWVHQGLGVNPSGTGAITVPTATVSGTGSEGFTATGAVAVPAATVAGTGTHESGHSGTGAVSVPAATVAGTGSLGLTATGAVTVPAATVSGTGTHVYALIGTGAITAPAPTVAGTGTRVGGIDPGGSGGRKGVVVSPPRDDTDDLIAIGVF